MLYTYQCNAPLPQVRAEGGGWSGLVGELIAKFPEVVGICNTRRNLCTA